MWNTIRNTLNCTERAAGKAYTGMEDMIFLLVEGVMWREWEWSMVMALVLVLSMGRNLVGEMDRAPIRKVDRAVMWKVDRELMQKVG